ncbi:hypothetical protein RJ640_022150 [Escallonia rubra]|uniref:ALOG domain-containing protein n=1 Tax=Escallonia rubra TaxID=112253 RepID=A0AA88U7N8_9ASTE|nr:hypothetical protein RJ640_022150 [Escallonia rubra]
MENPRSMPTTLSRYENQKRRDWNMFGQYLRNHRPPLSLARCSDAHVLEFLRYLNQFGHPSPPAHAHPCPFWPPSARPGAASTPSSIASAPPSRRMKASSSRTRSGRCRPTLPPQNPRFTVQSTGDKLREEKAAPTLLLFRSRPCREVPKKKADKSSK